MAFPEQYDGFIRDIKTLVQKRPIVFSTVLSVAGLVAIATIIIPSVQRLDASDDTDASNSDITGDRLDREININNTSLSEDDIRIGADIDSLEVLLSDMDWDAEQPEESVLSEPNRASSEHRQRSRRASLFQALLNPVYLADESASQRQRDNVTVSMYDDLFSPVNVQDSPVLEATISTIEPGRVVASPVTDTALTEQEILSTNGLGTPASPLNPNSTLSNTTLPNVMFNEASRNPSAEPANSTSTASTSPDQSPGLTPGNFSPTPAQATSSLFQPSLDAVVQTAPPPGTTGYTIPEALRSPFNPYTQHLNPQAIPYRASTVISPSLPDALTVPANGAPPGQSTANFISPTGVSPSPFITPSLPIAQPTYTVPLNTFAIPQTPSTTPSRFNGGGRGGEFNTFSNP